MDKIVNESGDIVYEPKSISEISNLRLNTGPVNMNDKRIENLASLPDLSSIDSILATPKTAVNINTMSTFTGFYVGMNTAYCGILSSDMDVKNKRLTNMADAELIIVDDPNGVSKIK